MQSVIKYYQTEHAILLRNIIKSPFMKFRITLRGLTDVEFEGKIDCGVLERDSKFLVLYMIDSLENP